MPSYPKTATIVHDIALPSLPPSLLVQAQRLASLRHPCIITLYGIIDEAGSCAMAVEFMRMGSLRSGMKLLQAQVREGEEGGSACGRE